MDKWRGGKRGAAKSSTRGGARGGSNAAPASVRSAAQKNGAGAPTGIARAQTDASAASSGSNRGRKRGRDNDDGQVGGQAAPLVAVNRRPALNREQTAESAVPVLRREDSAASHSSIRAPPVSGRKGREQHGLGTGDSTKQHAGQHTAASSTFAGPGTSKTIIDDDDDLLDDALGGTADTSDTLLPPAASDGTAAEVLAQHSVSASAVQVEGSDGSALLMQGRPSHSVAIYGTSRDSEGQEGAGAGAAAQTEVQAEQSAAQVQEQQEQEDSSDSESDTESAEASLGPDADFDTSVRHARVRVEAERRASERHTRAILKHLVQGMLRPTAPLPPTARSQSRAAR